jgi:hypothetical protein
MLGFTRLSAVCNDVQTACNSAEELTGLIEQLRDVRCTASEQISALIAA